jgi:hypothetical protein
MAKKVVCPSDTVNLPPRPGSAKARAATLAAVLPAEAFLLHITKQGLQGDGAAAGAAMTAIEEARNRQLQSRTNDWMILVRIIVRPGSVNSALEPLRMARKLDRNRETARMVLEPWIVEAALARLGTRRLTPEEQQTVVKATRTPRQVRWPEWWDVKPWAD